LQNVPSDGVERKVADGIFVYSDAPDGPPNSLVARPGAVRALTGTSVPLTISAIDTGDHPAAMPAPIATSVEPASLGVFRDGVFTARGAGNGELLMRSGEIRGRVPISVYTTPARITLLPERPNVAENGSMRLSARAFDERGFPVALPRDLHWRASGGRIDGDGTFYAATHDAQVTVAIGDARATTQVTVGSHDVPLPFVPQARFMSVPRGGDGSVIRNADALELQYALGPSERAAYAAADLPLPARTIALGFDIRDDGSGARVRVAMRNAINEQILMTAVTLDRPGWRHAIVRLPQNVAEPARLSAIYVIGEHGSDVTNGSIGIRNVRAIVAGSP
jgi:hypothetical protein